MSLKTAVPESDRNQTKLDRRAYATVGASKREAYRGSNDIFRHRFSTSRLYSVLDFNPKPCTYALFDDPQLDNQSYLGDTLRVLASFHTYHRHLAQKSPTQVIHLLHHHLSKVPHLRGRPGYLVRPPSQS